METALSPEWKSEQIGQLAAAMVLAQAKVEGAAKVATNPHFKSRYADLAAVWDACRTALCENGLAVIQLAESDGETAAVVTILTHKSGEWIKGRIALRPMKADPQGIGSALTYGRRYGLAAMVGVAPEDDDGNAASIGPAPARRAVASKPEGNHAADRSRMMGAARQWTGIKAEDIADLKEACRGVAATLNVKLTTDPSDADALVADAIEGFLASGVPFPLPASTGAQIKAKREAAKVADSWHGRNG